MNKTETRKEALLKHYATLEYLSAFLGKKQDGKKLSILLWKMEQDAHHAAMNYCNGDITNAQWDNVIAQVTFDINEIFGKIPPGFFVNGDARGYTLKINDDAMRDVYPDGVGLHRDMGGYGILSPEI